MFAAGWRDTEGSTGDSLSHPELPLNQVACAAVCVKGLLAACDIRRNFCCFLFVVSARLLLLLLFHLLPARFPCSADRSAPLQVLRVLCVLVRVYVCLCLCLCVCINVCVRLFLTLSADCSAGDVQTAAHIVLALGVDGLAACKIREHEAMSVLLE